MNQGKKRVPGKDTATGKLEKSPTKTFGAYLFNLRKAKGFTLRDVEEATGKRPSNAYLSQLEHGKISKPSPHILHSLASVYGVAYENLMEKAGYITTIDRVGRGKRHGRIAAHAIENLTTEEEDELLNYLAYIRSKKRGS